MRTLKSMGAGAPQEQRLLRRLARDHWVRLHGTPRVTVLAGGDYAKQLWNGWLSLADVQGTLVEGGANVDAALSTAIKRAISKPTEDIAVVSSKQALVNWRTGRSDRNSAMVDEGWLEVPEPRRAKKGLAAAQVAIDARSAAEAVLFEALEATTKTKGRFKLNASLAVRFGSRSAEVDLLSREDRIAVEIDGIHHFADADCYRRDRRKDLLLQAQGLLVIRLLAEDVMRDPRQAVDTVCQGLVFRRTEDV